MKMHSHRKRSRESLTLSAAVMNETVAIKIEQEQQQPVAEVKTEIQEQDEEMEITNDPQTTSSIDNGTAPMVTIYQNDLLETVAVLYNNHLLLMGVVVIIFKCQVVVLF